MDWLDEILLLTAEWFPTFKVTPKTTRAAWLQLFTEHRVTHREAREMLTVLVSRGVKYLDASTMIQAVNDIRSHSKSKTKTPAEIWAAILKHMGRGTRPKLSERTAIALESVGGWDHVAQADTQKELPFIRKDFLAAYEQSEKRDVSHLVLDHTTEVYARIQASVQNTDSSIKSIGDLNILPGRTQEVK